MVDENRTTTRTVDDRKLQVRQRLTTMVTVAPRRCIKGKEKSFIASCTSRPLDGNMEQGSFGGVKSDPMSE